LNELHLLLIFFLGGLRESGAWLILRRGRRGGTLGGIAVVCGIFRKIFKVDDVLGIRLGSR
jgi:hypothetical protein